jgi:copper chaperone CopZ
VAARRGAALVDGADTERRRSADLGPTALELCDTPGGYIRRIMALHLSIEGMTCSRCVEHVRRALERVESVAVRDVTVGSARVDYDPSRTTPERIAAAVADAGYPARPAAGPR